MARAVTVDTDQLRAGYQALMRTLSDRNRSGVDPRELGGRTAAGAFERFGEYWAPGDEAVTHCMAVLARSLFAAAEANEQRDAEDAQALRAGHGGIYGF